MVLDKLSEREMRIIKLRFGLDGEGPFTLEETGKILGITRERVRQIQERAHREAEAAAGRKRAGSLPAGAESGLTCVDAESTIPPTGRRDANAHHLLAERPHGRHAGDRRLRREHLRRQRKLGGRARDASYDMRFGSGYAAFPAPDQPARSLQRQLPAPGRAPAGRVLRELVLLGQGPEGLRRGQGRAREDHAWSSATSSAPTRTSSPAWSRPTTTSPTSGTSRSSPGFPSGSSATTPSRTSAPPST